MNKAPWDMTEDMTKTEEKTVSPVDAAIAEQKNEADPAVSAAQEAIEKEAGQLTADEKKQVQDFAKTIDLRDTKSIIEYGSGVQKKMADFSESVLDNVKTKDLGEVGDQLTGLIGQLKDFSPESKQKSGFFKLFHSQEKRMAEMKAGYDSAAKSVDAVADSLKQHQIRLMKDVDILDRMYASNLDYYRNLTMYILAGKVRLQEAREKDLPELQKKAETSGMADDAQAVKDLSDKINRFEKKIHDLELTRMVAIQTAPQIRIIQNNDTMMVEKIQSVIVNTIPLWKNQMVLAMGLEDSVRAAKAQNAVTEMTNELLQHNADVLKQSSIETAKASERGIVDIETLKKTNESLISTLDEVEKIQADGKAARAQAEEELSRLEDDVKKKLLEISGSSH